MLLYILVLDGVSDLGLSALTDVFDCCGELAPQLGESPPPFDLRRVSVVPRVSSAQGMLIPTSPVDGLPTPDVVLIPALGCRMPEALSCALSRAEIAAAAAILHEWDAAGVLLGAACTASFVLAETGLLNGQRATTAWWLSALFRARYPLVRLDETCMLVSANRLITAGAALAHLDLALSIVRRQSPALAQLCARYLLLESRNSQAVFVIPDHLAHSDPIVERFELWARRHLTLGFSIADAARATGTSSRTLARRLQAVLGKSPLAYYQDLRVERAVHLLQTSQASIEQIASQVGYRDGVSLRMLLRRKLGLGVRALRARAK